MNATQIPGPEHAAAQHFPLPFIVGVERSGTTLMRSILNAHPDLSLPYECHLWDPIIEKRVTQIAEPVEFMNSIKESIAWAALGVNEDAIRHQLRSGAMVADAMRLIYQTHAASQGKMRAGDKTPKNLNSMKAISRHLPEAHFIHIIRDGRAVAASLKDLVFSPAKTMSGLAHHWVNSVQRARQVARQLPYYLEIKYEDLVLETEAVVRQVCEFIELPFTPTMLEYHHSALDEIKSIPFWGTKKVPASGLELATLHPKIASPPDPTRIDNWRETLRPVQIEEFNEIALPLLLELGYGD